MALTAEALPAELRRVIVQLARTPRLLVACDYDGTLAPIVADPTQAKPLPESVHALRSLAALPSTTTAVISGRACETAVTFTPPSPSDSTLRSRPSCCSVTPMPAGRPPIVRRSPGFSARLVRVVGALPKIISPVTLL